MLKIEKEYEAKYGDIPKEEHERYQYLMDHLHPERFSEPLEEYIAKIKEIKKETISFTIYLLPKATPRPKLGRRGLFYVHGAADNKKYFRSLLIHEDYPMITTPCIFNCNAYFPIPSSMRAIDKVAAELGFIRPISRPDWDNVAKTYCDMIQESLLYDDSLIIEGSSKKFYSIKPRIEISLTYYATHDCAFNDKKIKKQLERM